MSLIILDPSRQWCSHPGRPRLIRDIELIDVFNLTQSVPANFLQLLYAVINPASLERQPRPGSQSLQAVGAMRDMLCIRVMRAHERLAHMLLLTKLNLRAGAYMSNNSSMKLRLANLFFGLWFAALFFMIWYIFPTSR